MGEKRGERGMYLVVVLHAGAYERVDCELALLDER
jgi:hypothetical protein